MPFFNEHKVYTEVDRAEILQLNHDFYRALDHTDLHTMKSIWLDSPETICMLSYPNDIISGYDNIMAYLSAMLPVSTPTEIAYTNLHFMGDVAIVTSDLRYNALKGDSSSKKKPSRPKRVISLQGYVTNIFVRSQVSGRFHLVGHYGTTKRVVHPYKNVYRVSRCTSLWLFVCCGTSLWHVSCVGSNHFASATEGQVEFSAEHHHERWLHGWRR